MEYDVLYIHLIYLQCEKVQETYYILLFLYYFSDSSSICYKELGLVYIDISCCKHVLILLYIMYAIYLMFIECKCS